MPDRPERSKAGTVSVNVPESVADSVDTVADWAGLPEPSSLAHRLSPDYVADAAGVSTPDELSDDVLAKLDQRLGVDHPPER